METNFLNDLSEVHRRNFMRWLSLSSVSLMLPFSGCESTVAEKNKMLNDYYSSFKNVFDLEKKAYQVMEEGAFSYLNGGADDLRTINANADAFQSIQILPRRLVDVRNVSTEIELFGETLSNPIILAPVGFQQVFHPLGEIASARAAKAKGHKMMVSSVSNFSVNEISEQANSELWFQLYPSPDRGVTKLLLERAEAAGCQVCALTVDTPVIGNRENSGTDLLSLIQAGEMKMGNFEGILPKGMSFMDSGMTWDMIGWLKANTNMKIVLKGIVTKEDALLALDHGADGIIVSNHGGRQLESDRSTIEALPEIVEAIQCQIPVLIDGGIRRGTDIFKALALGADAVCIGRPFCWGLGAFGQKGVEMALDMLRSELIRDMQLAGTTSIAAITPDYVRVG